MTSCLNGLGPVSSNLKKFTEKPEENELVGDWEVDEFSYEFIRDNYNSNPKEMIFKINDDNTYHFKNVYDFENPKDSVSFNVSGQWEIKDYNSQGWNLDLDFSRNFGLANNWFLFKEDGEIIIISFIGDPDSGDRLLFHNKN
jgi:hypothetical protein